MHALEIVAAEAEHDRHRVLLVRPNLYGRSVHQVNLLLEGEPFVHADRSGCGMEDVENRVGVPAGLAVDEHGLHAFVDVIVGGEYEHLRGDLVLPPLADEGARPQHVRDEDRLLG